MTLHIDIETFSSYSLYKVGLHKYTEALDFLILLFAYRIDRGPVIVIDLANGELIPDEILTMLTDSKVTKKAFNAQFERICLQNWLGLRLPASEWSCTMVKASMLGLPMSLEDVGDALNVDTKKQATGKKLIKQFTVPDRKGNRILPWMAPLEWEEFKAYCAGDVVTECLVDDALNFFPIPPEELAFWALDQNINEYGIGLDMELIKSAIRIDEELKHKLLSEANEITGLQNSNSAKQLSAWLELEIDERVTTLKKDAVHALLQEAQPEHVERVLQIRQQLAKTSVKKYLAASYCCGIGNRGRGLLQYYGAGRTGRHAGRLLQPHNFPKNKMKGLDMARETVKTGNAELLSMLYASPADVLSQLLRTMFVAGPVNTYIMADFAAIEARVIAWLFNEKWRLDIFKGDGKIYEVSAAKVFNVPVSAVTKDSEWRAMGKIYELALGFGGSVGAVRNMDNTGVLSHVTDDHIKKDVYAWRNASPNIAQGWKDVERAALEAVRTGRAVKIGYVIYFMSHGVLFCKLPSGRCLSYQKPQIRQGEYGDELWYLGADTKTHQWQMISTWGGKLVENIVQAVARDLLRDKMLLFASHGLRIVFHVHDEIIIEVLDGPGTPMYVNSVGKLMGLPVEWAPGLPLAADAYASPYYKKE